MNRKFFRVAFLLLPIWFGCSVSGAPNSNGNGSTSNHPTVVITYPAAGSSVSLRNINVLATITDSNSTSNVGLVELYVDGLDLGGDLNPPLGYPCNDAIPWDDDGLSYGLHTLRIDAVINFINYRSAIDTVYLVPPQSQYQATVAITSPLAHATVSGIDTIHVNVTDNIPGGWYVETLFVDGIAADDTPPIDPHLLWRTNEIGNGTHTLAVAVGYSFPDTVVYFYSSPVSVQVKN